MDSTLESDEIPEFEDQQAEQEHERFTEEAEKFARVGQSPDWQVIIDHFNSRISHYRDDLAGLDLKNAKLSDVGEKYLVCNLVAMELEAIKAKVAVTTEAVNAERRS